MYVYMCVYTQVYLEAHHIVPKGVCRNLVRAMAWSFFSAWTMFPLLFVFGPEGLGIISRSGSAIGHTVADIISKQLWGFFGHMLRVKVGPCSSTHHQTSPYPSQRPLFTLLAPTRFL